MSDEHSESGVNLQPCNLELRNFPSLRPPRLIEHSIAGRVAVWLGEPFTGHGARMGRCYEFSELKWLVRAADRIACIYFKHNTAGWWVVWVGGWVCF